MSSDISIVSSPLNYGGEFVRGRNLYGGTTFFSKSHGGQVRMGGTIKIHRPWGEGIFQLVLKKNHNVVFFKYKKKSHFLWWASQSNDFYLVAYYDLRSKYMFL